MAERSAKELMLRRDRAWNMLEQEDINQYDAYLLSQPGTASLNHYSGGAPDSALGIDNFSDAQNEYALVYDSTLPNALQMLVSKTMTTLFTSGSRWANLQARPRVENGFSVKVTAQQSTALGILEEQIFTAIHSSNADTALHTTLPDGLTGGKGVMKVHPEPMNGGGAVAYETLSQRKVAIGYSPTGENEFIFPAALHLSYEQIFDVWKDATNVYKEPVNADDAAAKAEPPLHEVWDVGYYNKTSKKWDYRVIQRAGEDKEPRVIFEDTYDLCPWIIFHTGKAAGTNSPRSPVHRVLPDTKVLNQIAYHTTEASAFNALGTYLVQTGAILNPSSSPVVPGGVIEVANLTNSVAPPVQPLPTSGRLDLAYVKRDELQASVRKGMMVDALPPVDGSVRSATEFIERKKELAQEIGALFGILMSSVGMQIIMHTAYGLERQEKIDKEVLAAAAGGDTDKTLVELLGEQIEIVFTNHLMQAQQLLDAQAILEGVHAVKNAYGNEAFYIYMNVGKSIRKLWEKLDLPTEMLNEEETADEQWARLISSLTANEKVLVNQRAPQSARAGGP